MEERLGSSAEPESRMVVANCNLAAGSNDWNMRSLLALYD